MATARVRIKDSGGTFNTLEPTWSLTVDSDEHGPAEASFVCKAKLVPPKWSEVEIEIDGVTVFDGWVEETEAEDEFTTVICWGWQRHLDDDLTRRTYLVRGFRAAQDARAGPGVDQDYWYRSGLVLTEGGIVLGVEPGTIFYSSQAVGVTFDLGENAGPRKILLYRYGQAFPAKTGLKLFLRAHSTRINHSPNVAGQYVDIPGTSIAVQGTATAGFHGPYEYAANSFRYVSIFLYNSGATYDMSNSETAYLGIYTQVLIATDTAWITGTSGSLRSNHVVVDELARGAPLLSAGQIDQGVVLGSHVQDQRQSARQTIERVDMERWRYRVNPGRRLDRGPYPSVPAYTALASARHRLRTPERYSRVVVEYRPDDEAVREIVVSDATSPRVRTTGLSVDAVTHERDVIDYANAVLADQATRRMEGQVICAAKDVVSRLDSSPLHPSRLLLAGGERIHVDDADDHARIARVQYDHDTETSTVDLTAVQDDSDRQLKHLEAEPV